MDVSEDILEELAIEIREIQAILKEVMGKIVQSPMKEMSLYENFGQVIDRLYGTAATLQFVEIANYCKMMKEITYKCGQSDNEKGIEKCTRMMLDCIKYLEALAGCIHNPEEFKKIRYSMHVEIAKGDRLTRSYFFSIKRTSCEVEKKAS
ncbi:MAG: hypothetical protein HQK50_07840 [Oligoflexia bacterium]|nr:hypothetical protein [Oligoflexia bacterium]MBF0365468.1 hypothetical protein [Oligoflexia bacterium]